MSKRKIVNNILKRSLIVILSFLFFSSLLTSVENIKVRNEIRDFKNRSIFESEVVVTLQDGKEEIRRYYRVPREFDYEVHDTRSVFYDGNIIEREYLGQKGDVFVTQQSPFPAIPFVHQIMTFYFGGHAAINNGNNQFIESTGFPKPGESIIDIIRYQGDENHDFSVGVNLSNENYWLDPEFRSNQDEDYKAYGAYYRKEFIGLRVKNINETEIDQAVSYAEEQLSKRALYNFLFIFDMDNKFYCTDLVSRAYQSSLIDIRNQNTFSRSLNDDQFITTVNDLILSEDTYITIYVEVIDGIPHIYYLEDY